MKKFVNLISQLSFLSCLTMLLISGCQQEKNDIISDEGFSKKINDSLTVVSIEEAKAYFNTNILSTTSREKRHKHGIEGELRNKIVKWDKAGYKNISFGEAVIVPMKFDGLSLVVDKKTRAYVPYYQLNYLMMYKDRKKSINNEWITLLPDSSWLYGNRNIYTGNVLVRSWAGDYIKMFKYKADGTSEAFSVSDFDDSDEKNARTNVTTFTQCMNMRSNATCTCSDKSNCDMCEICAPYVCVKYTLISEPVIPPGGSTGSEGGNSTGSGNGGGGTSIGGNYSPTCNPNIAPGTSVGPNQALPCGTTLTPVTVINNFSLNSNIGRFTMSNADQAAYPRFTDMVKNLHSFVQNDTKVMNSLKQWSGFSEKQILEKVQFGSGPLIIIKDMTGKFGYYSKAENPNAFFIDAS